MRRIKAIIKKMLLIGLTVAAWLVRPLMRIRGFKHLAIRLTSPFPRLQKAAYRRVFGVEMPVPQDPRPARTARSMCVAAVLDEFSFNCFAPECNLLAVTPEDWRQVFSQNKIDLFLCESAWAGNDSVKRPWRGRVYASRNFTKENRTPLLEILEYCNSCRIPTVFWNKEDPSHYEDQVHNFVATAKLFDHVFTTAVECVSRYKQEHGCPSVHVLPFATQPKLFSPIQTIPRSQEIVFAGSWYAQHPDRCVEMNAILQKFLDDGHELCIYDRHYGDSDPNHIWPEAFRPYTRPAVTHDQIAEVYKQSDYGLNINTATTSYTMFARRVFELMSCNTLVLTNTAAGVEEMFADVVVMVDGERSLDLADADQKRAAALVRVLRHHTYRNRLEKIFRTVGLNVITAQDSVSFFYKIDSPDQATKALAHLSAIQSCKKGVLLVSDKVSAADLNELVLCHQSAMVQVHSVDYLRRYGAPLTLSTDFACWADCNTPLSLCNEGPLHFQYLPPRSAIKSGCPQYTLVQTFPGLGTMVDREGFPALCKAMLGDTAPEILPSLLI